MKLTLDKRLDMIAEDISELERFVHEVAQHTAQIERTVDTIREMLIIRQNLRRRMKMHNNKWLQVDENVPRDEDLIFIESFSWTFVLGHVACILPEKHLVVVNDSIQRILGNLDEYAFYMRIPDPPDRTAYCLEEKDDEDDER